MDSSIVNEMARRRGQEESDPPKLASRRSSPVESTLRRLSLLLLVA